MKKLIIKIGEDMVKDIRDAFENPRKELAGTHTTYLKSVDGIYGFLSPKRLELLRYLLLNKNEKKSVGQVAKALKRKQEAISRDAANLAFFRLIEKHKSGQKTYLSSEIKSISIELV